MHDDVHSHDDAGGLADDQPGGDRRNGDQPVLLQGASLADWLAGPGGGRTISPLEAYTWSDVCALARAWNVAWADGQALDTYLDTGRWPDEICP